VSPLLPAPVKSGAGCPICRFVAAAKVGGNVRASAVKRSRGVAPMVISFQLQLLNFRRDLSGIRSCGSTSRSAIFGTSRDGRIGRDGVEALLITSILGHEDTRQRLVRIESLSALERKDELSLDDGRYLRCRILDRAPFIREEPGIGDRLHRDLIAFY